MLHSEGQPYDITILALLRGCTSESTDPRPHFQALLYRFCARLLFATLLFLFIQIIKNIFLPSILHFYHHLFAELVHPYNLPLYWCVGDTRYFLYLVVESFEGDYLDLILPGNGARKELDVYYATLFL